MELTSANKQQCPGYEVFKNPFIRKVLLSDGQGRVVYCTGFSCEMAPPLILETFIRWREGCTQTKQALDVTTKCLQEAAVCIEHYSPTSANFVRTYVIPYAMKYLMVCLATCGDF